MILSRRIGFGITRIDALLKKEPGEIQASIRDFALVGVLGILIGALLLTLRQFTEPFQAPELPQLGFRGYLGGLAVSVGAAVAEEVWFRLGLMTALAWGVARLRDERIPSDAAVQSEEDKEILFDLANQQPKIKEAPYNLIIIGDRGAYGPQNPAWRELESMAV